MRRTFSKTPPHASRLAGKVRYWLLVSLLLACGAPAAPDDSMDLDELSKSAEQWAKENLDQDTLASLQEVDQKRVKEFLAELQKQFQGDYVLDLAELNDTAKTILPLLKGYEETLPLGLWLEARLDYLDAADQLRKTTALPKPEPGKPPPPAPNPPPEKEREIWVKKVVNRPWPRQARAYVSQLKPVFAAERVPTQLVWIAEVESGFDPRARSPVGAAGLFQLMPITAHRYGLRTWPADQRLRPLTSARAAAQYLRALHQRYQDWRLALAAYNAGQGTVDKLLARHKAKTFDAIATHLPAETQMYVPRVEAVLRLREGVKLTELKS